MITYQQLTTITAQNSLEPFVQLENSNLIQARYLKLKDMIPLTGNKILVRKSVALKLTKVAKEIKKDNPNWTLLVAYGYRSLKVQTQYFIKNAQQILSQQSTVPNPIKFYETVHQQIAVPSVAGHPTGGAVDVCLIDQSNRLVNCGSKIYDLNDPKRFYLASQNIFRQRFRQVMISQGFAPYDGEWWHFSYGDKEWAAYYRKSQALYSQVKINNAIIKKYVK